MNPALLLGGVGTTVVFTMVLLVFEARESRLGIYLTKPLAAAGFIACALGFGALDSRYGQTILAGLCLSWLGDVLLISAGRGRSFLAGIVSFFLAHCAYGWAFIGLVPDTEASAVVALPTVLFLGIFMRWLWPHLEGVFRWAVLAYVIVIGMMVVLAAGAAVSTDTPALFAGAVLFAVSDVFVARQRFVHASYRNRQWGLPLYFLAQLILAASVAAPGLGS
jgi:uncharacterized membrane protein YhhN